MISFNVIWWDFNKSKPEAYDIMPYLMNRYKEATKKPKTRDEFREFVEKKSMYQWWGRCQYEIIINKWPPDDEKVKWDVHKQVMMNIDLITDLLIYNIQKRR